MHRGSSGFWSQLPHRVSRGAAQLRVLAHLVGARAPRGALSPAPLRSPVPAAQLCFCSSLQPKVGLRKGPAAAERSRSWSAPPAARQGLPRRPAAAVALPRLCWRVATMEEMVIWEQHTVTLSKVSVAQGGHWRGWGLWGWLYLTPLRPSLLGPSTGLWLCCLRRPGPSQQDDWGHSGVRFRCGVWRTGSGPAPVSAQGCGDLGGARCQQGREGRQIAPSGTGPALLPPCPAGMGSPWGNGCPCHPASHPPAGDCAWGRATAGFSLPGGRITSLW